MNRQTILITGGSRGIGREIVLEASARGYNVLFTYNREKERADEVIAAAQQAHERRCRDAVREGNTQAHEGDGDVAVRAYQLNVTDPDAIDALIERLLEENDQIHALINNAGTLKNNTVAFMTREEWDEVIATNLSGPFYMTRALVPHFISNRYGRIINMLSLAAYGSSGQANYSASKAGLIGLTLTLAREYGPRNVMTNGVVVGLVETDMVKDHMQEKLHKIWQQFSPLRRVNTAAETVNAVLFLVSDQATAINGEILHATGGLSYVP